MREAGDPGSTVWAGIWDAYPRVSLRLPIVKWACPGAQTLHVKVCGNDNPEKMLKIT